MSETLPTRVSQQASIYNRDDANHLFSLAKQFSESTLVPEHFRGKPADTFIALQIAQRQNSDPFTVLQNLYVVHGRPGWHAQYLIGLANNSGKFKTPIMFRTEGKGDALRVTAYATHAASGEEVTAYADMEMAKAEGWTRNSKYKTMPELMLRYRAATFLVRTYAPEVTFGLQTVDEIRDITREVVVSEARINADPKNDALERAKKAGVYDERMESMTAKEIDDEIEVRSDILASEREDAADQALEASRNAQDASEGSGDGDIATRARKRHKATQNASSAVDGELL